MAQAVAMRAPKRVKPLTAAVTSSRFGDALSIAEQQGLLSGGRTLTVRGRMPSLLVEQAKRKTGIRTAAKHGCSVLTRNRSDFDLLLQLDPRGSTLFYERR